MRRIRIYVEGGGDYDATRRRLRGGFCSFFRRALGAAGTRVKVIPSGSRAQALRAFAKGCADHRSDLNLLLVDSEEPVVGTCKAHVAARSGAKCPAKPDQYHLMVQAFEAWLVADPDSLAEFYGQGFGRGSLPRQQDVEAIPKDDLGPKLRAATRATRKGEYHKIQHAAPLLERLDPDKVRERAPHCQRLFARLEQALAAESDKGAES